MKKIIMALGSAMVLALAFTACEAEDAGTDTYTPNPTVYEGCMEFRTVACEKWVACSTFGGMTECQQWFDSENGYGGCNSANTTEMTDAATANYEACLAAIPTYTDCAALSDPGIETSIPSCDNWP
jgi:hypothetical protein